MNPSANDRGDPAGRLRIVGELAIRRLWRRLNQHIDA